MSDPSYLPQTAEGRMLRLIEECGEVLQAIGKLQRFGPESCHPRDARQVSNRQCLLYELADLCKVAEQVAQDLCNPEEL